MTLAAQNFMPIKPTISSTMKYSLLKRMAMALLLNIPVSLPTLRNWKPISQTSKFRLREFVAAYHMAGATFLAGTPVYATKEADEYGHNGGGKALIDNFTAAFGDAFDSSIPTVTNLIEGDTLELAGISMKIVRNADAFDIEIPELNVVYTHMLGHDCHSIVAGAAHADAIISQLEGYKTQGIDLVLTSHYTPEDLKDVQTKIDYLENLKSIASTCSDAASFKAAVQKTYPEYAGENYLDMTVGFFFAE